MLVQYRKFILNKHQLMFFFYKTIKISKITLVLFPPCYLHELLIFFLVTTACIVVKIRESIKSSIFFSLLILAGLAFRK